MLQGRLFFSKVFLSPTLRETTKSQQEHVQTADKRPLICASDVLVHRVASPEDFRQAQHHVRAALHDPQNKKNGKTIQLAQGWSLPRVLKCDTPKSGHRADKLTLAPRAASTCTSACPYGAGNSTLAPTPECGSDHHKDRAGGGTVGLRSSELVSCDKNCLGGGCQSKALGEKLGGQHSAKVRDPVRDKPSMFSKMSQFRSTSSQFFLNGLSRRRSDSVIPNGSTKSQRLCGFSS